MSLILALALQAAPACPATPVVAPGFTGWTSATAVRGELEVGRAAIVPLSSETRLAVTPGKPPAVGSLAAAPPFVVRQVGTYRVALDAGVWIDVTRDGAAVASTGHGHGPACSGIRKIVDFRLTPGRYVLQLSGATKPSVTVMIARAS